MFLVDVERDGPWRAFGVEAHSFQGNYIHDGGDQHLTVVFETDEAAVEQMIYGRGQKQPVGSVKALLVS